MTIRERCLELGIETSQELQYRMVMAGRRVTTKTTWNWWMGRMNPSPANCNVLADVLETDIETIKSWRGNREGRKGRAQA